MENICENFYETFNAKKDNFASPNEFIEYLKCLAIKNAGSESKIYNGAQDKSNFFASIPRLAYSLLILISTQLFDQDNVGILKMYPDKCITKKFFSQLNQHRATPEGKFLLKIIKKMKYITKLKYDDLIYNIITSALGCFTATPPRIEPYLDPVLKNFFKSYILKLNEKCLVKDYTFFPVQNEYIALKNVLTTLQYNGVLVEDDKIAVVTPILPMFFDFAKHLGQNFETICIQNTKCTWEIEDDEIFKITDKSIRVMIISNPAFQSLSERIMKKFKQMIKKHNNDLIIIELNSFSLFTDRYISFMKELPLNTINVFSLAPYFGTYGSGLSVIMMNKSNIIDKTLHKEKDPDFHKQYETVLKNSTRISFIDRMVADSAQVFGYVHAGLSSQQQLMIALYILYDQYDTYNCVIKRTLLKRKLTLLKPIEYTLQEDELNSNYYVNLNIIDVALNLTGSKDFIKYIKENKHHHDFIFDLAEKFSTVVVPGVVYTDRLCNIRITIASLCLEELEIIGENIRCLIDDYYVQFQKFTNKQEKLLDDSNLALAQ